MNVLWLTSWFPNRTNPTTGDFIERHAKAVAPFVKQLIIIAVTKDDAMAANGVDIEKSTEHNISVYRVYYGKSRWGKLFEKMFSLKKYLSLHQQVFEEIMTLFGKPDIVHVHVSMKAGIFARQLKRNYHIPYIITEHWSGYYKHAKPSVIDFGGLYISLNKKVFSDASLLTTVSNELGKSISDNFIAVPYQVVPNVVDTSIFFPAQKLYSGVIKLIHASGMGYEKNTEAIIRALSICKQQGANFVMHLYGPVHIHLQQLVEELKLGKKVFFHGEVPQPALAKAMQQSDALVLYSRYETFGCVLIEANACGVPVIVSDLPVFHDLITENVNGIFVKGNDPYQLAEKLAAFALHKHLFNKNDIAAKASSLYSYDMVGRKFKAIYDDILKQP
jgi:glycosyltransferase involved in cell wall biosynthesis